MKFSKKETIIIFIYVALIIIGLSLLFAVKSDATRIAGGTILGFVMASIVGGVVYAGIQRYYY